jgi:hypothetical protein
MRERPPNYATWFWSIAVGSAAAAFGLTWLLMRMTHDDANYESNTLLVFVPALHGAMVGALSAIPKMTFSQAMGAYALSALLLCISAMSFMLEGAICMLMMAPVWLVFGILGLLAARLLADFRNGFRVLICVSPLVFAGSMFRDAGRPPLDQLKVERVRTEIVIGAPPEAIWPYLFNLENLPEPNVWYFRAGIAHPKATRFDGEIRTCALSTGDMRERIITNSKNRRLEWSVLNTPPTMRELNPFGEVHPSHLTTTFQVVAGGFDLQELPNGTTRLVGWTTYRSSLEPHFYWDLWNRAIVREVHKMVMEAVRERAER